MLVRVAACGLNFGDLLMIKGSYQEKPPLPYTLGTEISGTVEEIGVDVTNMRVGQRLVSYAGIDGLAEYAALPSQSMTHKIKLLPAFLSTLQRQSQKTAPAQPDHGSFLSPLIRLAQNFQSTASTGF